MFHRFNASARRVLLRAFREAKRQQHDFVGTEHLLYGLLCDSDGPAVALLRSLHVQSDLMLEKVELSLDRHDPGIAMERFPLSPASKRVFTSAANEAARMQHQMIGPEHLLLGVLAGPESEAAQILGTHGITLASARTAVAGIPAEAYAEAKIQEQSRLGSGDSPTAAELARWMATKITCDETEQIETSPYIPPLEDVNPVPDVSAPPIADVEKQLRRTQLVFGAVLGFAFGFWLSELPMGIFLGCVGALIAWFRSSWAGIVVGGACGLFLIPMYAPEPFSPMWTVIFGMLGAFLGSFLGDAWRISTSTPIEQPQSQQADEADRHARR